MKTIWKYQLEVTDSQSIATKEGAKVLCVQVQHGAPCVWVELDESMPAHNIEIKMFGTGHPINDSDVVYLGTFQLGSLVFHVYL